MLKRVEPEVVIENKDFNTVVYCNKCVINNKKPITSLESKNFIGSLKNTTNFTDGICDACRWTEEKNSIDWESREEELQNLCHKHRRTDGGYDVIVPSSGGKDSRYVAHYLKNKYAMNPLTVTWKPHMYTQIGLKNVLSFIDAGYDNYLISPNGKLQKLLSRLAFQGLGHPFQPFIIGQRHVGPNMALHTGAKLVFYGENVAEYGNKIEDNYSPIMDTSLYTSFNFFNSNKSLEDFFISGLPIKKILKDYNLELKDFAAYNSPDLKQIEDTKTEVHYMSYYRKWFPLENYYYAVENTGFEPNPERKDGSYSKYAGIDDKMEDLHYYMQYIKFGMGRATWDAAQEIRTNIINRDEGITLVKKYDHEYPKLYFNDILEYLSISEETFWSVIDRHRNSELFIKDSLSNWKLKTVIR